LVEIGLDISRLKVTYFSGNDARSIEGSRKHDPQEIDRKIKVDYYIEEDPFKKTWLKAGLKESQLEPNNTRDNFLTSAWYVTRAPWGYRNEILYLLSDGSYLDIGTIERMTHYPKVITDRDSLGREAHYVTEVSPWELRIIVDAIGIERILQALEDKKQIWKIELFKPLIETEISIADIERIRILHRIFTDSTKKEFGSKNRRYKVNQIIRSISHLDLDKIISVLKKNSEIYQEVFPELKEGIENTIKEIQEYRKMQVDWKFKRQLKGGQKTK
jgi:alanyl-tRNA synthetase